MPALFGVKQRKKLAFLVTMRIALVCDALISEYLLQNLTMQSASHSNAPLPSNLLGR